MRSHQRLAKPTAEQLDRFTREELRDYAKEIGVRLGQNKSDTIHNLLASRATHLCISLWSLERNET